MTAPAPTGPPRGIKRRHVHQCSRRFHLKRIISGLSLFAACLGLAAGWGCRRESNLPEGRTPPNPSATAQYAPPRVQPSAAISRVKLETNTDWRRAPFYVIETELSPATLVHSTGRYLGLFRRPGQYGLGAPTHVAWSTREGPRCFKNGAEIDVTHMQENWGLVWFAGAPGWNHWDSPWAFFLQNRPASMKLDGDGLHLTFSNRVGDVVLVPLYGAYKPPLPAHDFLVEHGLPGHKIKTGEWAAGLPRDPLIRLRFWSRVSRRFPVHCEDSFSVNRGNDSVTLRSSLNWYEIEDEWKTPPLSLAPLSPVLALAAKEPGLPVRFSAPPFDLGMFTTHGPYFGIPDVQEFTATFSVLQYINEKEATGPRTNSDPVFRQPLARLQSAAGQIIEQSGSKPVSGSRRSGALLNCWFARALPYYDATTATNAVQTLRRAFMDPASFAVESFSNSREAGDFLQCLWAYAHFSGDWEVVRQHWPSFVKLFRLGAQTRWAAFGRPENTELGQGASVCAAFARLAFQAGDMDSYHYACAIFARELVHDWVRVRGVEYFRQHQPIASLEFMEKPVYLTQLNRDGAGWEIDGPKYPVGSGQRHYTQRWRSFADPEVGRFFQDYLGPEVRSELDTLMRDQDQEAKRIVPLIALRSLLLNESPSQMAPLAAGAPLSASPFDAIATAVAFLRTSQPIRFERLIAGDRNGDTPFVVGPEREIGTATTRLVSDLESGNSPEKPLDWPKLEWRPWKTASGHSWTVGHIQPVRSGVPRRVTEVPLNWNTRVLTFELP